MNKEKTLPDSENTAEKEKRVFLNFTYDTLEGIFWAAVSVLCWSSLFVVVSYLTWRGNMDPYTLVYLRFTTAGICMLLFIAFVWKKNIYKDICRKDWIKMIFHGIAIAGMSLCLFIAQNIGLPVVNASMLEAETPLVLFVLGLIFLRNRTSVLQIAGLFCGFAGCMLVLKTVTAEGFAITSFSTGDLLVFAAASFWAVYTILAKDVIKRVGGLLYTAWSMTFAGMWTLIYQLVMGYEINCPVMLPDILWTLYLGVIPTAMAFFAWNNAMKYISTGLLAISGYFTPIFSALLAAMLFKESVTGCQIFGMILVFGSAFIEPEIADGFMGKIRKKKNKS